MNIAPAADRTSGDGTPLVRGIGLGSATALNMIDMIGVGPFITIPLIVTVMGGPQAAGVLATVRRENIEAEGKTWSAAEEAAFKKPVLENFEREGHPYYATARLWDDGIIAPGETRRVVALALSAALNAPIPETKFGVFRM